MPEGTRTYKSGDVALELDTFDTELGGAPDWGEWFYTAFSLQGWFRKQHVALDFEIRNTDYYGGGVVASGSIKAVPQAADA